MLRLCRAEENLLKKKEVLIVGDKVGWNWVGKLDWLGERYGTGIKIWRQKKRVRGLEQLRQSPVVC